jgi:Beta-propeller repeat
MTSRKHCKALPDAFVTKFCPTGTLEYSIYLGGGQTEVGHAVAVDVEGDAYVTGFTNSPDFPTKNAFQPMLGAPNAENAFVTKISAK